MSWFKFRIWLFKPCHMSISVFIIFSSIPKKKRNLDIAQKSNVIYLNKICGECGQINSIQMWSIRVRFALSCPPSARYIDHVKSNEIYVECGQINLCQIKCDLCCALSNQFESNVIYLNIVLQLWNQIKCDSFK